MTWKGLLAQHTSVALRMHEMYSTTELERKLNVPLADIQGHRGSLKQQPDLGIAPHTIVLVFCNP